jgi:hypothetical protein
MDRSIQSTLFSEIETKTVAINKSTWNDEFLEAEITDDIRSIAEQRDRFFYAKIKDQGTYRKENPRQRLTGFLAEAAIKSTFRALDFSPNPRTSNFIHNGLQFESKAQGCNSPPKADYVGTLYPEQLEKPIDYYIFSRVLNNLKLVWICGMVSKHRFLELARYVNANTPNRNFTYDQARYDLEYGLMSKVEIQGLG